MNWKRVALKVDCMSKTNSPKKKTPVEGADIFRMFPRMETLKNE